MTSSMEFPGFERLYYLSEPFATRAFRGALRGAAAHLDPYALARGELRIDAPLLVHRYGGSEFLDFIWTDCIPVALISGRAEEILRSEGITGWSTYPVELDVGGAPVRPQYAGLSVTGRAGEIEYQRSEVVLTEFPGGTVPVYRGWYFDSATWDGSDLFCLGSRALRVATERFRRLVRTHRLRNVRLRALPELETPAASVDIDRNATR